MFLHPWLLKQLVLVTKIQTPQQQVEHHFLLYQHPRLVLEQPLLVGLQQQ
jgi:hypothetical protein